MPNGGRTGQGIPRSLFKAAFDQSRSWARGLEVPVWEPKGLVDVKGREGYNRRSMTKEGIQMRQKRKRAGALLCAAAVVLGMLAGCGSREREQKEYTPGGWVSGTRYESEFWGLAFQLPQGWIISDTSGLDASGDAGSMLDEDQRMQAQRAFEEGLSVPEMMVSDGGLLSISMVTSNLASTPGTEELTETEYAQTVREQLSAISSVAYEVAEELSSRTIGGKEFQVLSAWVEEYGAVQWYAIRKEGSCILTIICTFPDEGGEALAEEILAGYSSL